jgi:threonine/homoserine/homoserine lactone efflux protein
MHCFEKQACIGPSRAGLRWLVELQRLASSRRSARSKPWQRVRRGWGVHTVKPKGTVFGGAVAPQFPALGQPLWPQCVKTSAALAARVWTALDSATPMRRLKCLFGALFVLAGLGLTAFKPAA